MAKLAPLVVAVALLVSAAAGVEFAKEDLESDDSLWKLYELWGARYKVARDPGEKLRRFAIFKEKVRRIYAFHQFAGDTQLGLNILADLSDDEVYRDYRCARTVVNDGNKNLNATVKRRGENLPLPLAIDWRTKTCNGRPCLTPVKDQARCGACWAFATTAALESHNAIRRNTSLVRLSEQQLVDCDTRNNGCDGGFAAGAFQYVKDNGLASSAAYPYRARKGICRARNTSPVDFGMVGFALVPPYDEYQLLQAVTYGPVVVPLAIGPNVAFDDYHGGPYRGECGTDIDHEMLLVGYTHSYYILRNSYGENWGDKGYMLLPRNTGSLYNVRGTCGILMDGAAYPEIESLD